MTLTVEVPPDVEAGLLAQAQAQGLDLSHYVENVLRREQWPTQQEILTFNGDDFKRHPDITVLNPAPV